MRESNREDRNVWKGWIWRYWLGRLGRTAAFVMFVCLLSVGTTAYIVNGYVQALLGQFGIKPEESPFSATGVWKSIRDFQMGPKTPDASSGAETGNGKVSDDGPGPAEESGTTSAGSREAEFAGETDGKAGPEREVPPEDAPRESGWADGAEGGIEDAWADQRGQAYRLLFERLTAEQLDRLAALLEDGLTGEEAAELESLLRELFTEEEWKRILQILEPLDDRFRMF